MRIVIFFICFLSISENLFAGDGEYDVAKIPAALKKNAHVVKRSEEIVFELLKVGEGRLYKKYAITILDEQGDGQAQFVDFYNKFYDIRSIDGTLYDASGKKIRSLKKGEIRDVSGGGGDAMVDDNRFKVHNFYNKLYPYTVEYEVEVRQDGTLFFPDWSPVEGENYSVQQSRFSVVCPANYKLRYKPINTTLQPSVAEKGNRKTYTWELTNISAIEEEYASRSWSVLVPKVIIGASDFKMENYAGNMETWQDFGKFVYDLKKGRDQLPENIKATVHQLTNGLSDPKQKIQKLYEFMQANTRYVGIQLGIGGWQPFDATYVGTKRYGDCKALSNYMYSLLKEAGINSFYTLIRSDEDDKDLMLDFPSSQFNHVILCVPVQKDTVWLECTSQTDPAGFLGFGTYDRPVLLIDENGGKIVRTPKYTSRDNLQIRRVTATVDPEGNVKANIKTHYTGLQQSNLYTMISMLSKEKVMEVLKAEIDLATYDVDKFEYKPHKSDLPSIDETLDLNVTHYASASGKRLFITPNILTRHNRKLQVDSARKYSIVMNYEYKDIDTVVIKVPAGYKVEAAPKEMHYTSAFGTYKSSVTVHGDQILYYRSFEKKSGEFPPEKYAELATFYEQMYKADRSRVVLVKE